ncbi:MAG: TetR/AcrR family transcriptional regulator [Ignavibacteriales bacterium]|nr:TetR/AcrR family transcriptional regulator [Ignavibacteriales bacterium]
MGIQERKEREKGHRREEILDAAQKVFFEKGLHVATMDEIAEKAELSKGTLYLYYKSKEDLYLAVMMRGMEILRDLFSKVTQSDTSTAGMLVALGDAYLSYFNDHREYFRMVHFLQSPQFHKQVTVEMKQSCGILNRQVWEPVTAILQRCIDEGILRKNLNPAEVGIILWSSATALMLRIDSEYAMWKETFHIDLSQTLKLTNNLLFDAICTEHGRTMITAAANH